MIAVEDTVLILLAAGRSERFGDIGSKLDQPFLGKALGLHVAVALEAMLFRERIAIIDRAEIDYGACGFRQIRNDDRDKGMSHSLHLGVSYAKEIGADAICVALADMPRVTAAHIHRLFDATEGADSVVASSDGEEPKPPAIFGRAHFERLLSLEGDAGARDMIKRGRRVVTNAAELIDVDTREQLDRLRDLVHAPEALTRVGTKRLV
ncbi:nucleotidyltransferase family protein [uncultured Sphingomonas sp.]|uniref:nucleotidyltransferase family protein n=1 Tax=uncultured Sphingomonas sp. TaxID=158754 RepID=UPI0035CA4E54